MLPTLAALHAAVPHLGAPQNVAIEAGAPLQTDVAAEQAGLGKNLSLISELGGIQHSAVTPLLLLLELGMATTPPIPNLMRLSSRWSLLRYLWAFAPPRAAGWLRLSDDSVLVRYHQMTLLSEDMGIALTHHILKPLLAMRHPNRHVYAADAEFALTIGYATPPPGPPNAPAPPTVAVKAVGGRRPDYFFVVCDPPTGAVDEIYAVECKGTRYGRARSVRQMADGTSQVTSVRASPAPGQPFIAPPSFVFGTTVNRRQITVRALDPPSDFARAWATTIRPRDARRGRSEVRRTARGEWEVDQLDEFAGTLVDSARAQQLVFAGSMPEASDLLGLPSGDERQPLPVPDRRSGQEVRETRRGEQIGTALMVELRSGFALEVFMGVQRELHEALVQRDAGRETAVRRELRGRSPDEEAEDTEVRPDGAVEAHSIDGGVLRVRPV